MTFEIKTASRKKAKLKMLLSGPSGSGKTYSALLLASGMIKDWSKIVVIDTERGSADLYSDLGPYNTLQLEAPFTPENYVKAIDACLKAGMEIIIIDSITHEWDGKGGVLEIVEQVTQSSSSKNSFTAWGKVTPRHSDFIDAILQSPVHMICTGRTKTDYVLSDVNGKQVPKKVGLKTITREGVDYEFTIMFELSLNHLAAVSKDRTNMFDGKPEFVITAETGKQILDWCNSGIEVISPFPVYEKKIKECKAADDLVTIQDTIKGDVSKLSKAEYKALVDLFRTKQAELSKVSEPKPETKTEPAAENPAEKPAETDVPFPGVKSDKSTFESFKENRTQERKKPEMDLSEFFLQLEECKNTKELGAALKEIQATGLYGFLDEDERQKITDRYSEVFQRINGTKTKKSEPEKKTELSLLGKLSAELKSSNGNLEEVYVNIKAGDEYKALKEAEKFELIKYYRNLKKANNG